MPRKKSTDKDQSKKKGRPNKKKIHDDEDEHDSDDDKGVGPSSRVAPRKSNRNTNKSKKIAFDNGQDDDDDEPTGGQSGYESGWGSLHSSDSEEGLGSWTRADRQNVFADTSHLNEDAATMTHDGETFFEVEGILSWRRHPRRGHPQFRALWSGFPIYANTWEPEQNFTSDGGEIANFWERVGGRPDDCPKPAPNDPTPLVNSSTDTEELIADEDQGEEARRKVIRQLRKDKVDRRKYWQWARAKEKAEQEAAAAEAAAATTVPVAAVPRAGARNGRDKGKGKEKEKTKEKEKGKGREKDKKRKHDKRPRSSSEDTSSGQMYHRPTSPKKRKHTIILSDDDERSTSSSARDRPGTNLPTSQSSNSAGLSGPATAPVSAQAASQTQDDEDSMDDLWNEPPGRSDLPPSSSSSTTSTHGPPQSGSEVVTDKPPQQAKKPAADARQRPLAPASLRALQGLGPQAAKAPAATANSGTAQVRPAAAPAPASSTSGGSFLDVITGGAGTRTQTHNPQGQARQGTTASAAVPGSFRGAHKNRKQTRMLLSAPQIPHKRGGAVGSTTTVPLRSAAAPPTSTNGPTQAQQQQPPPPQSPQHSAHAAGGQPRNEPPPMARTEGARGDITRQPADRREPDRNMTSSTNETRPSQPAPQPRSNGDPRLRQRDNAQRYASGPDEANGDSGETHNRIPGSPSHPQGQGTSAMQGTRPPHPNAAPGPGPVRQGGVATSVDPRSNDPYAHIFVPSRDPRRSLQPIKTTMEQTTRPEPSPVSSAEPHAPPRSADPRPRPNSVVTPSQTAAGPPTSVPTPTGPLPPWAREGMRMQSMSGGRGVPAWVARAHQQRSANGSAKVADGDTRVASSRTAIPTGPASTHRPAEVRPRPQQTVVNASRPLSPTFRDQVASREASTGRPPTGGEGAAKDTSTTARASESQKNGEARATGTSVDTSLVRQTEGLQIGSKPTGNGSITNGDQLHPQSPNEATRDGMTPPSAPSPVEQQRSTFRQNNHPQSPNGSTDEPVTNHEQQQLPQAKPAASIPLPAQFVPLHVPDRDPRRRKM